MLNRREMLSLITAAPFVASACRNGDKSLMSKEEKRAQEGASVSMPVIFVAHGAPILLDDARWMAELAGWAGQIRTPEAILMISAHWENRPATIAAERPVPLVYDFYGFPERFYQLTYGSPGAPQLASRVQHLLRDKGIPVVSDPDRGLDHGAFVPLMAMFPDARVPVLQLSMPALDPAELLAVGRALAPLRFENVLIVGSGFLTHNMRYAFQSGVPEFAREFDQWAKEALLRFDLDAIADFENRAPAPRIAHPTTEHYAPLILAAAAAAEFQGPVSFPIEGFWMDGAFTKRSVQFG